MILMIIMDNMIMNDDYDRWLWMMIEVDYDIYIYNTIYYRCIDHKWVLMIIMSRPTIGFYDL